MCAAATVGYLIILFAVFSFVVWEFNPRDWPAVGRYFFAIFWLGGGLIINIAIVVKEGD